MSKVTRKTKNLYEFDDEFSCRRFANKLDRLLISGPLSLKDIDREARSFFGSGYSSEEVESSYKDYSHVITTEDISVHIWSDSYATMTINKDNPAKRLTLDDFRDDLREALGGLFEKYKDSSVLKDLDEALITIKVQDGEFAGGHIYKGVD